MTENNCAIKFKTLIQESLQINTINSKCVKVVPAIEAMYVPSELDVRMILGSGSFVILQGLGGDGIPIMEYVTT